MSYYLVVFRSRNETFKFVSILNSYGYSAAFVNTPRKISVSCGVSAKIDVSALDAVKLILLRRQFYTFAGIYYAKNNEFVKI